MTKISNLYSLTNYITANSSGNIVISAPSSGYALDVTGTGRFTGAVTAANFYVPSSNEIRLYNTNSTNWGTIKGSTDSTNGYITLIGGSGNGMTIANSGNVGIGTSTPGGVLSLKNAASDGSTPLIQLRDTSNVYEIGYLNFNQSTDMMTLMNKQAYSGSGIAFGTNSVERARINVSGYFKASNAGTYVNGATSTYHSLESNAANSPALYAYNSYAGDSNGVLSRIYNNSTASFHFGGYSSSIGDYTVKIYANGNIQNTYNSYGALSDIKLKENVIDTSPKLNDLLQVRVVNYNLISNPELKQIGVIAQELEEIFPGMVEEVIDRDEFGRELGTKTKSVKYSVFVPMLIKAIQELSAKVTALENK